MPNFDDKLDAVAGVEIPTGAGAGLVAVSDGSGNVSWSTLSAIASTAGTNRLRPSDIGEDLDRRRSSECSTMPHMLCDALAGVTLTTGTAYAALAYNKTAQTYTKIRVCTGSVAPSAVTSLVLGVTDVSGNQLATTADIHSTVTSASTLYDNVALSASVTLTLDQPVYLGLAWAGTTLNILGLSTRNSGLMSLSQLTHTLNRSVGSYSTGAMPNLTNAGGVAILPWVELIP